MKLVAVVLTPRTVCARVELTKEQQFLYEQDGGQPEPPLDTTASSSYAGISQSATAACLPIYFRAHVTLGYTRASEAVRAGVDLMQVLALQAAKSVVVGPIAVDQGTLSYYGDGQCYIQLAHPLSFSALFSACY